MSILQSIKWINRHGTTCALLVLLLLACAGVHYLAFARVQSLNDIVGVWEARLLRNMAGIKLIHGNWWCVLPYVLFFFGTLIYLELRAMPRWAIWSTFIFLAVPMLGYMWTCMRVANSFILVMGPAHSP